MGNFLGWRHSIKERGIGNSDLRGILTIFPCEPDVSALPLMSRVDLSESSYSHLIVLAL